MEPNSPESNSPEPNPSSDPKPNTLKTTAILFAGGAGAGLVAFALFGGAWQVNHFWWVMAATSLSCGLVAVALRQNFQTMLKAVMDNLPWY